MLSVNGDPRAKSSSLPPLRKYYFHIASKCKVYTDDRGVVLSDLRPLTAAPFRQDRRTGRHERRDDRRTGRTERRDARRTVARSNNRGAFVARNWPRP